MRILFPSVSLFTLANVMSWMVKLVCVASYLRSSLHKYTMGEMSGGENPNAQKSKDYSQGIRTLTVLTRIFYNMKRLLTEQPGSSALNWRVTPHPAPLSCQTPMLSCYMFAINDCFFFPRPHVNSHSGNE